MAGILTSPKINLQIKNRNAIERRKHGFPNIKDLLRQKCIERMKSKRSTFINRFRTLASEEVMQSIFTDMVEMDIKDIQNPGIQIDGGSVKEPGDVAMDFDGSNVLMTLSEEEQWILDNYDRVLESSEAIQERLQQVICPFCQAGCLDDTTLGVIKCNVCEAFLRHTGLSLLKLEQCLISAINDHEKVCSEKSYFTIVPDNNISNILLICSLCECIRNVI